MYSKLLLSIVSILFLFPSISKSKDNYNFEEVGRLYNYWGGVRNIEIQDNYAFVTTAFSGLQIVDVSDPEEMRAVGYDDTIDQPVDLAIDRGFAYVIDEEFGLCIYDVDNISVPRLMSNLVFDERPRCIELVDTLAIIGFWGDARIVSIADRYHPVVLTSIRYVNGLEDIQVSGNKAYCVGSGCVQVVSIEDIDSTQILGEYEIGTSVRQLALVDDYLYLATDREGIKVMSVEQPDSMYLVKEMHLHNDVRSMVITDNYAYVVEGDYLNVILITDPRNPRIAVNPIQLEDYPIDIDYSDSKLFLIQPTVGLSSFTASHPGRIEQISRLEIREELKVVEVLNNKLFVGISRGIFLHSLDNPIKPVQEANIPDPKGYDFDLVDNLLYVAGSGINSYNIEHMNSPQRVRFDYRSGHVNRIDADNDKLYALYQDLGLKVRSREDEENLEQIGFYRDGTIEDFIQLSDYLLCATTRGLKVISAEDPTQPELIYTGEDNLKAYSIVASNGYVFLGTGNRYVDDVASGVVVYDIDEITEPNKVGFFEADMIPTSMVILNDILYILQSGDSKGVFAVSVENPRHMQEIGYYRVSGFPDDITISEDGTIYVAENTHIGIYKYLDPNQVDHEFPTIPVAPDVLTIYPNPFNSETTIHFDSPTTKETRIDLFSLDGRKIRSLMNGLSISGTNSIAFDGSGLVAGEYFVRLQTDEIDEVEKLILLK